MDYAARTSRSAIIKDTFSALAQAAEVFRELVPCVIMVYRVTSHSRLAFSGHASSGSATGTVRGSQGKQGCRSGIQSCSDKAYTYWTPQTIQDARAKPGLAGPRVSSPEGKAAQAA